LGADFLINLPNDAWFGKPWPAQHASHLILRAIETRWAWRRREFRDLPSSWIRWVALMAATKLDGAPTLPPWFVTSDVIPLYVRLGDWVGALVRGRSRYRHRVSP